MTRAEYDELSFGQKLKAAGESDPRFARSVKRLRAAAGFLLLAVAFAGAVIANIVNFGQATEITNVHNNVTKIEHSACAKYAQDPTNRQAARTCAALRAQIARSEPIQNPCISYQRVTGDQGANCSRSFVDHRRRGAAEPLGAPPFHSQPTSAGTAPAGGGGATHQPSQGTQHPGPHGGGGHHGSGGASPPSHPEPGTTPTESAPITPAASETPTQPGQASGATSPEPTSPEPAPEHPIREAAGGLLQETGEAANGTLCGVTGALTLPC